MNWTDEQLLAINARGANIYVSAAAGSGKTAVMTQRVVSLLLDGTIAPERLLVCTFTVAAAGEMRSRIKNALQAALDENPGNSLAATLISDINKAQISTIDSFLGALVRENYYRIENLRPDFTYISEHEENALKTECIGELLDKLAKSSPEEYDSLAVLCGDARGDNALASKILKLYSGVMACVSPERRLEELSFLNPDEWKGVIRDDAAEKIGLMLSLLDDAGEIAENEPDGCLLSYGGDIASFRETLTRLASLIADEEKWDDAVALVRKTPTLKTRGRKNKNADPNRAGVVKGKLDYIKKSLYPSLVDELCATNGENEEDCKRLSVLVARLCSLTGEFYRSLLARKSELNRYSFDDILHFALTLTEGENGAQLALSDRYDAILIDEFQDTTPAQAGLFEALAGGRSKLFCVGDVKQSIYGFRNADPGLFIQRLDESPKYDGSGEQNNAKIFLRKNFRSAPGVIDGVNYLFERIMKKNTGEIDYDDDQRLYCGREDAENVMMKLCLVNVGAEDDAIEREAAAIARLILDRVSGKCGKKREFSDFCILMRSTSSGRAEKYARALSEYGVPASAAGSRQLLDATEVNIVLNIIRAVMNPGDDVALLGFLTSPVLSFSPDELSRLRIKTRKGSLYSALKAMALEDARARDALETLLSLRNDAVSMSAQDFILKLIRDTGLDDIVAAMSGGEARRENIFRLCSLAADFERSHTSGIAGFTGYIDRLRASNGKIEASEPIPGEGGAVTIMTMHKSKGLEFPVVIIPGIAREFNRRDLNDNLLIERELGAGVRVVDSVSRRKIETLSHTAAKIRLRNASVAEEMRVLYVAMTRAKDELIMTAASKNIEKKITDTLTRSNDCPEGVRRAGSYFDWIVPVFFRYGDMRGEVPSYCFRGNGETPVSVCLVHDTDDLNDAQTIQTRIDGEKVSEYLGEIKKRTGFVYPFETLKNVAAKRTASEMELTGEKILSDIDAQSLSKPRFMEKDGRTGTFTGTANHKFLQYCRFDRDIDIGKESERLAGLGLLTPEEANALSKKQLARFFESELLEKMMNADEIYREKRFSVFLPARVFDEDLPPDAGNEQILVQGVFDVLFIKDGEITIVDYKSDRVSLAEELIERYEPQLRVYRLAAEAIYGRPVSRVCIYSVYLAREIYL